MRQACQLHGQRVCREAGSISAMFLRRSSSSRVFYDQNARGSCSASWSARPPRGTTRRDRPPDPRGLKLGLKRKATHHFPREGLLPQPPHEEVLGGLVGEGLPSEPGLRGRVGERGDVRAVAHAVVLLENAQRELLHRLRLVGGDAPVRAHLYWQPNPSALRDVGMRVRHDFGHV